MQIFREDEPFDTNAISNLQDGDERIYGRFSTFHDQDITKGNETEPEYEGRDKLEAMLDTRPRPVTVRNNATFNHSTTTPARSQRLPNFFPDVGQGEAWYTTAICKCPELPYRIDSIKNKSKTKSSIAMLNFCEEGEEIRVSQSIGINDTIFEENNEVSMTVTAKTSPNMYRLRTVSL